MLASASRARSPAVLLVAGGSVHFDLWNSGYRHIPKIGPLFMANVVASIALAAAVMTSRRASVAFAGITFAVGSLVTLVVSRTVGVFGFTEAIWTTQATNALVSEVGVILALGATLIMQRRTALEFAPATVSTFKNPDGGRRKAVKRHRLAGDMA